MKFTLEHKTKFFYFLATITLCSVLVLFYLNNEKVKASSDLVEHTQIVISTSNNVMLDILEIETGTRGYLLTQNPLFLNTYSSATERINTNLKNLSSITKDNPTQHQRIDTLQMKCTERTALAQTIISEWSKDAAKHKDKLAVLLKGNDLTATIRTIIYKINTEEFRLLSLRKSANEKNNNISKSLFIFLLSFIIIAFGLLAYIIMIRKVRAKDLESFTQNQKALSKYSLSLIEASRDPLVTISPEGKITDMNEATVKITGLTRGQLKDTDFLEYFTDPIKAREVYQLAFANGYVKDSPLTLRHKDGNLTEVLFNGSVYKDDLGKVLGAVVVARDITDQKIFENELIEAKQKAERATDIAEQSNKLKEAFLANMSHEIRTPMNAIIGFSDILSKRDLGQQEHEYIMTIKTAGESLLTIINDILDISKIEAGMMTFEDHPFSIKQLFKSLNVMLDEKAKEKNLELNFNYDENVPETLLGDNTRLTQIILNLVDNAIKFTQKGKVEINVTKSEKNTNGDVTCLKFTVSDTGIGIPEEKLENIFERFRQAESHTTRKYGGTGLGLSIAKQLVELQGGNLEVKSELNKGSVFTFNIPYKNTTDTKLSKLKSLKKYNLEEFNGLKILVVEDNKLNVKLIHSLFSDSKLVLDIAENGSIGIEKLRETKYDIILMDMEMPVMNGYEAATFIRKELKNNIPIIAMTAHAMAGERERCLSLGMNDYISKPINANTLFEKIHELTINN